MPAEPLVARASREWDDLARFEAYESILTLPQGRTERWEVAEFLATGKAEVADLLAVGGDYGLPAHRASALDVGCGVGRISLALADHFERVAGVDISAEMLARARVLAQGRANCSYSLVRDDGTLDYAAESFDLVYCGRVLQHLPNLALIERLVDELLRVLAPGGLLVAMVPAQLPLRRQIQLRRRLYGVLHALGVSADTLLARAKLTPMSMRALPMSRMEALTEARSCRLLTRTTFEMDAFGITQSVYYVTRPSPTPGVA